MKPLIFMLAVALAGCSATREPEQKIITVTKIVVEPCISKAPERPTYNTGKGAWPDDKLAAVTLADDFERAEQYGVAWEAAAAGCIKP